MVFFFFIHLFHDILKICTSTHVSFPLRPAAAVKLYFKRRKQEQKKTNQSFSQERKEGAHVLLNRFSRLKLALNKKVVK